ncbi:MAG: YabP/YqfC family sporulation protein [Bacilli bacterium]
MKTQIFNPLTLKIVNNNKIVISNYTNIIDFNPTNIIIDIYDIKGLDLVINRIDELSVEINGKIQKIEVS